MFFGNPDKASPALSPNGKHLAYLAPEEGVLNVWVRTLGRKDDRAITHDRKRGIRSFAWAWDDRHILYEQDKDGDENWHLYAVDLAAKATEARDLTPFDGVQAGVVRASRKVPGTVLVRMNKENPRVAAFVTDDGPVYYYLYDRTTRKARFLFTNRRELEELPLARMKPVIIPARDGLKLVSYLTLPPGRPPGDLPMVLFVHGGPWARDRWGYNPYHQWLANRGYAVLSVNFRGSTGFGKAFLNAGNREWVGKMHDDLVDGVEWAVTKGYADPKRVAVMGGSYGGYAVLVGAAFTPDLFCCGVDIVGPSNMMTLIKSIPPYWTPLIHVFKHRVGDWEKDPEYFASISPLFKADRIKIPLLIGQGKNDPRVKVRESLQIVEALKKKGKEVIYIEFPDEGHGFRRPENNKAFNAAVEAFLARHLGGRCEPPSPEEQALLDKVTQT